jgi:ATP-binding cassette subfamily C protein CydD
VNEHKILQALAPLWRKHTTLLVTHRVEQLQQADHILLLQQGQLVTEGSFMELSQQNDDFRALLLQPDIAVTNMTENDYA